MVRALVAMGSLWVAILFHCSQVGYFVYGAFDLTFKMEPGDLFFVYIGSAAFIHLNLTEGLETLKDVKLVSERGVNAISLRNQAFKAVGYSCLVAVYAFPLIAPLEFYTDYYLISLYLTVIVFVRMLREREKEERDE